MNLNDPVTQQLLSGLIGSVLTFFFGVIYTMWRETINKKEQNRSFIFVDEVASKLDLKNLRLKENTRMLYNHAYEAVKQKHREEFQRDKNFLKLNTANYIKIVNLGTGLIFNCVARTKNKLDASEEESWDVNAEIGILSKDEEVFFCTDNAEYWGQAYNTVSVIVDYESSVGEKLRYVRKIEGKDDDMIVIENFYKKSWFFYRRFSTSKRLKTIWLFLNNDK